MAASTSSMSLASLPVTLFQAITFLTRPLINRYPASTIHRLQTALGANLTSLYTPIWYPSEPLRGSGRRCLSLSPSCLPPRPVHNACAIAKVQWSDWIALLGGVEFDMFIDPGFISIRVAGCTPKLVTVWSEELELKADAAKQEQLRKRQEALLKQRKELERQQALLNFKLQLVAKKTLAQQFVEEDDSETESLLSLLNHGTSVSSSIKAVQAKSSFRPTHSRSSSSDSLSAISLSSDESDSDASSMFSYGSLSTSPSSVASSRASSEKPVVFVDTSKKAVTPYDGGKTTVLTGGVMLGASAAYCKGN